MADDSIRVLYNRLALSSSQFRLLRPRSIDDGSISHYTLGRYEVGATSLSYLAVSYTWGSQPFDYWVNIDGIEVEVTKSCHDALLAMRHTTHSQWLSWIDQLCIDQVSLQERSSQVLLMSSIYSGAELVLVWLDEFENLTCGLGDDPSPTSGRSQSDSGLSELQPVIAIREDRQRYDLLQQDAKDTKALVEYLGNYYRNLSHPGAIVVDAPVSEIPTSIRAWDRLFAILGHRYFSRRWILQEIIKNAWKAFMLLETELLVVESLDDCAAQLGLMRQSYCRDFDELLAPEVLARIRHPTPGSMDLDIFFNIGLGIQREGGIGLMPLLMQCEHLGTTDPLDCVYALRALTTDVDVPDPDYTLTNKQLLLRLARSFIIKGQAGDLLGHSGLVYHDGSTDIPSWCPPWIASRNAHTLAGVYKLTDFRAAGLATPRVSLVDLNESLLKVCGAMIDKVHSVTEAALRGYAHASLRIYPKAVESLRASAPQPTISRAELEHLLSSFEQTLSRDPPFDGIPRSHYFTLETLLQVLLSPYVPLESLHISKEAENPSFWKLLWDLQWKGWLSQRCFCVTSKGFVGIAPLIGVKVGDLVAVLAGVNVPMILRPNPDQEGTFQIVSDSYFIGLGKGEAMETGLYADNEREFILS